MTLSKFADFGWRVPVPSSSGDLFLKIEEKRTKNYSNQPFFVYLFVVYFHLRNCPFISQHILSFVAFYSFLLSSFPPFSSSSVEVLLSWLPEQIYLNGASNGRIAIFWFNCWRLFVWPVQPTWLAIEETHRGRLLRLIIELSLRQRTPWIQCASTGANGATRRATQLLQQ